MLGISPWRRFVHEVKVDIAKGKVEARADTVADAKLAIKELKLKKKELALAKKQVTEQQREIRAAYTEKTRHRMPRMRGGGEFGRIIRAAQSSSHAADRQHLAKQLAPLEKQRDQLESLITTVDTVILKLEGQILSAGQA